MTAMNGTPRPEQLIFDLPIAEGMSAEDFLVTDSNRAAFEIIMRWPEDDVLAGSSPLLNLHGPEGSGKTHLAEIWRARTGALRAQPDDVCTDNLPALLSTGRLVIEDMPGAHLDETALFHLINMARENHARIMLTARTPPAAWPITLPDLATRLAAAQSVAIAPPDDALLRALLVKLFTDRQLRVPEEVISYLLVRMERSAAAAQRLVTLIDREALKHKAKITRPFVARLLKAHFAGSREADHAAEAAEEKHDPAFPSAEADEQSPSSS